MRTAYFLGAGASYSLRPELPLARDLTIRRLLDRREYAEESDMAYEHPERGLDVIAELEKAIVNDRISSDAVTARLECVLDELPAAAETLGLREMVLFLVMKRLAHPGEASPSALYSLLWESKRNGDIFLTTNYDTLLEWELGHIDSRLPWRAAGAAGPTRICSLDYGAPEYSPLPIGDMGASAWEVLREDWTPTLILKLHGSVSWTGCPSCGRYDLESFYQSGAADSIRGWLTCKKCGSLRRPILVPPVNCKDVESHPVIRAIWTRAYQEMKSVDRVVFAGFSLDPSDERVRRLLRETNSSRLTSVVVVDPVDDGSVGERFREIYGSKVEVKKETWTSFLVARRPAPYR